MTAAISAKGYVAEVGNAIEKMVFSLGAAITQQVQRVEMPTNETTWVLLATLTTTIDATAAVAFSSNSSPRISLELCRSSSALGTRPHRIGDSRPQWSTNSQSSSMDEVLTGGAGRARA